MSLTPVFRCPRKSLCVVLQTFFALLAAQAAAQERNPASAPANLEAVVVRAHYDNSVGTSDAASQGVVRGEVIQDIPLLRPGEALETVPGMVVTQHSGDGKANQYFLRGYNLDHGIDFASFIDGVPVNMPTNAHGQGYSDVNYLIPELLDRIDYRKGPYFAEFGDFSSAGSADMQYRKTLDRNIADATIGGDGYRRLLLAGSAAVGAGGLPNAGGGAAPAVLGAVEFLQNDGPWTVPERLRKTNALVRLSDESGSQGWAIDVNYYDAKWNATDQVPLELIDSGQLSRFSAVDPYDGGATGRYIVSGNWHDADESGYRRVSAFAQHYRLELWSNFTLYENNPVQGDQMLQAENRNLFGIAAVRGWIHTLFGHTSTTEAGFQLRHDNINVSLSNTEARIPYQAVTDDNVRQTSVGLYVNNTTQWTPWLRTLGGVRVENEDMTLRSRLQSLNDGSASGSKALPKLSVVLGPWNKTELFVNAGKGVHSNDARGVIDKVDPSGAAIAPSPVLATSTGKEVGLRTEAIGGLQSSLAVWSLNSDSEILYSADAGGTEAHGPSRRYGIEWNNHWSYGRWLLFDADLARSHSRFADDNDGGQPGNLIPNAVSKVAMIRASIHNVGPWSAGWETRYISGYPLTQDGTLWAPSAVVTNVRLQREITKDTALSLDALNVFNCKYFDIAYAQDYRVAPGSPVVPVGETVHPGEPREFRATLRVRF